MGNLGIKSSGLMFICKPKGKIVQGKYIIIHKTSSTVQSNANSHRTNFVADLGYLDFGFAGTQVEVQTPVEALVDEASVGGHQTETRVLLGQEVHPSVLRLHVLPFLFLQTDGQTLQYTGLLLLYFPPIFLHLWTISPHRKFTKTWSSSQKYSTGNSPAFNLASL